MNAADSKDTPRKHKNVIANEIFARRDHSLYMAFENLDNRDAIAEMERIILLEAEDEQWERIIGVAPIKRHITPKPQPFDHNKRPKGHIDYWWLGIRALYGKAVPNQYISNAATGMKLVHLFQLIKRNLHGSRNSVPQDVFDVLNRWMFLSVAEEEDYEKQHEFWKKYIELIMIESPYYDPDIFTDAIKAKFFYSNPLPARLGHWLREMPSVTFDDHRIETKIIGTLWRFSTCHDQDRNGNAAIWQSSLLSIVAPITEYWGWQKEKGTSELAYGDSNSQSMIMGALAKKADELTRFARSVDTLRIETLKHEWKSKVHTLLRHVTFQVDVDAYRVTYANLEICKAHVIFNNKSVEEQKALIHECIKAVKEALEQLTRELQLPEIEIMCEFMLYRQTSTPAMAIDDTTVYSFDSNTNVIVATPQQ